MGRTSKFTFPVPGRRAKPEPPAPMPSGPMSKAHRILGTAEINTGIPPTRTWDTNSVSGISVTLSETTCSYSDATLGLLNDTDEEEDQASEMRRGGMDMRKEWEQESEIIPKGLQQGDGNGVDMSDLSSVRRKRMSTSTITSFYDKSKMPLSISQQTSSSAMAKGPPGLQRVPSLVDEESSTPKKKKKPARLDLSYLLPSRSRSSKNLVLGPDMMTKSPSLMSISTEAPGLPAKQTRAERRLTKKAASESLKGKSIAEGPSHNGRPRGTNDTRGLHSLYDHYEQMTFRSIMGDGIEEADSPVSPEDGQQDEQGRKSSRESVPLIIRQPHNEARLDHTRDLGHNTPGSPPMLEVPNSPGMVGGDCSASVSSKYTRTSKASKRTNQSMVESDLNEKSILSLSDDSDDELTTSAAAEGSSPLPPCSSVPPEHANPIFSPAESHRLTTPRPHSVSGKRRLSSSVQPTRSPRAASHHFLSPPPSTPPTSSLPEIPKDATRRASAMPTTATRPQRSSSRASAKTSSSRGSTRMGRYRTILGGTSSPVSGVGIQRSSTTSVDHSARLATPAKSHRKSAHPNLQSTNTRSSVLPHQLPQFNMVSSPPPRHTYRRSSKRSSSDQPTPPLSPESVGSGKRPGSADDTASSRFMAVTKQEEMLLSALRNKRKHMRETILAEFEEADRSSIAGSSCHRRDISHASSFGSLDLPASPTGRRRMSLSGFSSSSSVTMDAPIETCHRRRRSSLAGPPSHLTFATTAASDPTTVGPDTPSAGMNPLYKQEYYFSTSAPTSDKANSKTNAPTGTSSPFTPYKGYSIPAPRHLSFISPARSTSRNLEAERHERVLLYLDRPMEEEEEEEEDEPAAGDIVCGYDGEPSPDLSDIIDFDDMSTDPVTPATGPGKRASQGSEQFSPKTVLPAGHMVQPKGQPIAEEEPIPDFEEQEYNEMELGIPRPDSPISPAGFLAPPPAAHQSRQNTVRISAVGPAGGGVPTSLWADEDLIPAC